MKGTPRVAITYDVTLEANELSLILNALQEKSGHPESLALYRELMTLSTEAAPAERQPLTPQDMMDGLSPTARVMAGIPAGESSGPILTTGEPGPASLEPIPLSNVGPRTPAGGSGSSVPSIPRPAGKKNRS